ncbi:hypothetical protein APA_4906 [Pseudanabaena sp. lw0831]|nr:hypothetical protein APA_4906 [Pseudanabaena sp. lw0831]
MVQEILSKYLNRTNAGRSPNHSLTNTIAQSSPQKTRSPNHSQKITTRSPNYSTQ